MLSWEKCFPLALTAYGVAIGAFVGAWKLRPQGGAGNWQGAVLFAVSAAFLTAALALTVLAIIRHPSQERRFARRLLRRAYLVDSSRPSEPIILPGMWVPPCSTPTGAEGVSSRLQAPRPQKTTLDLLEKVWGADRAAPIGSMGDLHSFMAGVAPKLAYQGLQRWRKAMLMYLGRRSLRTIADHVRIAALLELQKPKRNDQTKLQYLLETFADVHEPIRLTKKFP
jgi:hypothetical protein